VESVYCVPECVGVLVVVSDVVQGGFPCIGVVIRLVMWPFSDLRLGSVGFFLRRVFPSLILSVMCLSRSCFRDLISSFGYMMFVGQ
jgi:hypothetical protein